MIRPRMGVAALVFGIASAASGTFAGTEPDSSMPVTQDSVILQGKRILDSLRNRESPQGFGERRADSSTRVTSMDSAVSAAPDTAKPSLPMLVLLPTAAGDGETFDSAQRAAVEAGVRLGASQAGLYQVPTEEEAARLPEDGKPLPSNCFTERCARGTAMRMHAPFLLLSQISRRDTSLYLKLALFEVTTGRVRQAVQLRKKDGPDGLLAFAQSGGLRVVGVAGSPWEFSAQAGDILVDSGRWREIALLNPKDSVDNRVRAGWAGSGLLLAGVAMAWAQGQLLQEDDNPGYAGMARISGDGASSFLRGFFAAPTLGARYAAMGGAGIAHVNTGLALLMNPAGLSGVAEENIVAAKRSLPDGSPSFFLAYASPLIGRWSQGLGAQYEGDGLENETTLQGALSYDWGGLGKLWTGIRTGAEVKLYLAKVGDEGTGLDRSTGHSFGMGLDLGLQAKLSEKITAALTLRDVASFLRHTNTLTDENYAEVLPPEYRIGAAYRASPDLLLLLDGQKGMFVDQADHVRLGAEKIAFGFLALRCGLHQIFGRETVRMLSLGFGLDTQGLSTNIGRSHVALNYAYEFGLDSDQPLGSGQQFSLDVNF